MKGLLLGALLLIFTSTPSRVSVPQLAPSSVLSLEEATSIICAPYYQWDCSRMVRMAERESGLNPLAINYDCYPNHINPYTGYPYKCIGLLQVIETNIPVDNIDWLQDPYYNVQFSYDLWLNSESDLWGN